MSRAVPQFEYSKFLPWARRLEHVPPPSDLQRVPRQSVEDMDAANSRWGIGYRFPCGDLPPPRTAGGWGLTDGNETRAKGALARQLHRGGAPCDAGSGEDGVVWPAWGTLGRRWICLAQRWDWDYVPVVSPTPNSARHGYLRRSSRDLENREERGGVGVLYGHQYDREYQWVHILKGSVAVRARGGGGAVRVSSAGVAAPAGLSVGCGRSISMSARGAVCPADMSTTLKTRRQRRE